VSAVAVRQSGTRLALWLAFVLLLAALNYYGRYALDVEPDRNGFYKWSSTVGALIQFVPMLLVVVAIAGASREALALRRPRSWGAAAGTIFLVLVATLALSAALAPLLPAGEEQGLTPERWDPQRWAPFAASFVLVAGFVPVVEELTFRGIGYSLLERFGQPVAIGGTAVLFGLAHGLLLGLPVLIAFGVGLALVRHVTRSVYPCILLHGIFNGFALIASVTLETGSGS